MRYRTLGRTGVQVSRLAFGVMSFGTTADEEQSAALYRRCRDAGINLYDTADVYGAGRAEEILGRLVAGSRDELVLASKVHFPTGPDANARGLSRRHIRLAVEASLKRLGTDRIDLYYAHGFDAATPMEETLGAFDDLVRAGKILYPAVSNWAAWQVATALGISAREHLAPFQAMQPMYSLVKRQAEVELLPLAAAAGLGVLSYSPLGGGLLSGKYEGAGSGRGRLEESEIYKKRYEDAVHHDTARRFVAYARERGQDPVTLAVAWVASHPAVTAPLLGARSLAQLEPALAAAELDLSPEERAEISALSPEPPAATDRSEERQGLVYGAAKR